MTHQRDDAPGRSPATPPAAPRGLSLELRATGPGAYALETRVELGAPIDEVFAFFLEPANLEAITPPWLRFKIRTPGLAEVRRGTLIEYALRLHGVPIRWLTQITAVEPPHRFVDEQRRGPYLYWIHQHRFRPLGPSRTLATDRVDYAPPGGALANRLLVARDLRRIFAYRTEQLLARFGA